MTHLPRMVLSVLILGVVCTACSWAYITVPVVTLGAALTDSTYVTVLRVDKVSREKGIILYTKVRDLKGKYPQETIRHIFDVKGTPAHKGLGHVPIRPDKKDWQYAIDWAQPGKIAIQFSRQYDPFGDFGHTYIDGCWYATMCPPRDWQFWYAIYADPRLLEQWHAGAPLQLVPAVEAMLAGREAIVPVLSKGSKDDLRAGRAQFRGLRVQPTLRDFAPARDLVTESVDATRIPDLLKALKDPNRDGRVRAVRALGVLGPAAKAAIPTLAESVRNDPSGTVRMTVADALASIGPEAKSALPALEAGWKDPRMAHRQEVQARLKEIHSKLK